MTWYQRFRAARAAHGHTQTEAAIALGVSLNTIQRWERPDEGQPRSKPIRKAAERYMKRAPKGT